ncbi:hypothetical protein FSARC_7325 [Fusarium sarcochroum]|uniref:FAD-binding FR-type domain-containing protein n=1 Tax=Fusarium sarcochroum TaxID=1208366 RepID=A0A8H4TVA7_9HYPO|nr:hypothetical protein FSARC_7325 [Fusarium sarcochroum]
MAGGSAHADPAFLAKLARRQQMNYESMTIFSAAIAGFFFTLCIFHLARRLCVELGASRKPNILTAFLRSFRAATLNKIPGLPAGGYTVVIVCYLVINVVVTFTNHDNENMPLLSNLASRTGWMAIANLLIVIFLSLKNTPVSILTALSYERLNVFHRVAGYATLIFAIVHSCAYAAVFGEQGLLERLLVPEEICGMVATISLIILALAGAFLRTWWYEAFYYLHVTFWIVAIIMTGLHQPEPSKKVLYIFCAAAGIWVLERIVRLIRIAINSTNNTVTLMPLPNGGTRVTLAKAPLGSASGKHGFLWIPAVRAAETHPFTMVSTDPLEFVVAAYDGFTQTLHERALQNPGIQLKASVEGPYGISPDARGYDRIVLVAGGSGASFTVGATLDMLKKLRPDADVEIEFIWMIRNQTYLTWFSQHLETLRKDRRVSIKIYVTRASAVESLPQRQPSSSSSFSSSTFVEPDLEKEVLPRLTTTRLSLDTEEQEIPSPASSTEDTLPNHIGFYFGRPNVASLVKEAVGNISSDGRVLVMGCGPQTLMTTVRNAAADCTMDNGAGVELHLEQFGW